MGYFRNHLVSATYLSIVFVFIFSAVPVKTFALSEKQKTLIKNNVKYYNIDACAALNQDTNTPAPDGPLFILGDSIMYGAVYGGGGLDKLLEDENIKSFVDAQGSRGIKDYKGRNTNPYNKKLTTGMEAVEIDKDDIAKSGRIIIELGTNQEGQATGKEFKDRMNDLVKKMKSINPGAKYYAVDFFSTAMKNRGDHNKALDDIAEKENIEVIKTTGKVTSLDNVNVHPSYPEGYKQYNKVIMDALGTSDSSNGSGGSTSTTASDIQINGPYKKKANPGDKVKVGDAYKGKASTYGEDPGVNYIDPGDVDSSGKPLGPALAGASNATPGIAVYNEGTLGGWWKVIAPNKKGAILQQTDYGPSTSRTVDINTAAARKVFDYKYGNDFPTDQGDWKIEYMGKKKPPGAITSDNADAGATDTQTQEPKNCACGADSINASVASSVTLPDSIPKFWRELIMNAASKHKSTDPRTVATVLWVENRGWPDPNTKWSVSEANAAGPFQFIPDTWASMGYDGDGDGKKDPNNPRDAVHAAFIHLKNSAGKPIVKGFTGSADSYFDKAVFERDGKNLLSFIASYNGSGAPNNTPLKNFARGQNSDYVIMAYWLLASNFEKGFDPNTGKILDLSKGPTGGAADTTPSSGGPDCSSVSSSDQGNLVGDLAWPVPEKFVKSNWEWFTKVHHDHPSADIPVPDKTNAYSITPGKVVYVCKGYCAGYGNVIAISYKDGLFRYQHGTDGTIKVKQGDEVKAGQLLFLTGNTGYSIGSHLHVSIETGGNGTSARNTEHCPQDLFKMMKAGTADKLKSFSKLATSGCVGGASLY